MSRESCVLRNFEHVQQYKLEHPCECGVGDPEILEFDHVRGNKKANISTLTHSPASIATIDEEIAKCEVRCSNCHRKETARRGLHLSDRIVYRKGPDMNGKKTSLRIEDKSPWRKGR